MWYSLNSTLGPDFARIARSRTTSQFVVDGMLHPAAADLLVVADGGARTRRAAQGEANRCCFYRVLAECMIDDTASGSKRFAVANQTMWRFRRKGTCEHYRVGGKNAIRLLAFNKLLPYDGLHSGVPPSATDRRARWEWTVPSG